MDFSSLFKQAGKVAAKNSPAILTALGVSGTLTTAYLAAQAAFKSVDVLKDAEEAKKAEELGDALRTVEEGPEPQGVQSITPKPLTRKEQVEAVWKLYVPAAMSAAMTVSAIIFAARIQDRRNAALASAYTFAEKSFKEYRDTTAAKIGKKKEQEVRDEVAQKSVTDNPPRNNEVLVIPDGNVLCRDSYSGRYFLSDMESLRKAVNDLNWEIHNEGYASLSDWWHFIGVDSTSESDDLGWNMDAKFEVEYSTALTDQNKPCIVVTFRTGPIPKFHRNYR
jgi:hypothetical protein